MEITIYSKAIGKGVVITRYDRENSESREYQNPTPASFYRVLAIIQKYKAYSTDTPPHWTRYTLIKDPVSRNHYSRLHSPIKTPGQPWQIDEEIYNKFLGMLPPLEYTRAGFYMREFCEGRLTTRYSRRNGSYYCEFAIYPPKEQP